MKEAELISASLGEAEVQTATLAPRPAGGEEPAAPPRRRQPFLPSPAQPVLALAAVVIAFAPSLVALPHDPPALLSMLAPVLALALALLLTVRRPAPEPDIHDRYLDNILGLFLLGLGTTIMVYLPRALSIFFWSWRLDMLAVPLFLSGALALLCGARTLWRYRLPVAVLLLAWPSPLAWLALPLVLWFAVTTFRRHLLTATASPTIRRTGGGLIAAGLVAIAALLTAVADRHVDDAMQLLLPDGRPLITASSQAPLRLAGIKQTTTTIDPASVPAWGLTGKAYRYDGFITLNVFRPADSRDLSLPPTMVAQRQGYRLADARRVDLGDALLGEVERYSTPGRKTLLIVWWDWPVQVNRVARERVLIEQLDGGGASVDRLVAFARAYVASIAPSSMVR